MPGEARETVIMGVRYRMRPLGFLSGRQVAVRLMPAFLSAIGDVVGKVDASKGLEGLDLRDLGGLLEGAGTLLEKLGDDGAAFVTDKFAEACEVYHDKGEKSAPDARYVWMPLAHLVDQHFEAAYDRWLMWLVWGVQVNRFLGAFSDRAVALSEKAQEHFASPKESTGTAGGSSSPNASTSHPSKSSSATGHSRTQ